MIFLDWCLLILARLWEAAAEVLFVYMLVLFGKGYTVTRGRLSLVTWIKTMCLLAAYVITYAALFITETQA